MYAVHTCFSKTEPHCRQSGLVPDNHKGRFTNHVRYAALARQLLPILDSEHGDPAPKLICPPQLIV